MGENPVEGVSPVELGPSSSTELMGSPPTKGADPSAKPSSSVEVSECTATLAPILEHQAEVHSSDTTVKADAAALAASQGLPLIKPKPIDPLPIKFTGDLRVVDDELEIINFVPTWEVCHMGHQVKQEPLEYAPCFPWAVSHHHPAEELQEWSNAPNPMMGHVRADTSDHLASSHVVADDSQPSISGAVLPPTTSSSCATPVSSILPQDITAAVALSNVSRSVTPMPCIGRHPIFVHLFQLSTIDPPANGPILYVGTQLAGSTKALQ